MGHKGPAYPGTSTKDFPDDGISGKFGGKRPVASNKKGGFKQNITGEGFAKGSPNEPGGGTITGGKYSGAKDKGVSKGGSLSKVKQGKSGDY